MLNYRKETSLSSIYPCYANLNEVPSHQPSFGWPQLQDENPVPITYEWLVGNKGKYYFRAI